MAIRKNNHHLVTFIDSLKHDTKKSNRRAQCIVQRQLHANFKVFSLYCADAKRSFILKDMIAKYYVY